MKPMPILYIHKVGDPTLSKVYSNSIITSQDIIYQTNWVKFQKVHRLYDQLYNDPVHSTDSTPCAFALVLTIAQS